MVQLDVGDHRMIEASETEIAQFAVVVLERFGSRRNSRNGRPCDD